MKVLLLNLPFDRKVQRDYGCPHGVKADYYWPPIDMLMFGAAAKGIADLEYIDCIAGAVGKDALIAELARMKPDHVFTIISSITLESDLRIISEMKAAVPGLKVWASGDVIIFEAKKHAGIDFYVRDLANAKKIAELLKTGAKGGEVGLAPERDFSIGICPHEFVKKYPYSMPYSLHQQITVVLTNYGCPFKCKFCNSNNLGFRARSLDEVVEELKYVQSLGIREVYFRDFTFAIPSAEQLCDRMLAEGIRLDWSCETRVDVVDEKILAKMKKAGCFLVFYGAETGNEELLVEMQKGFKIAKVREMVALTKRMGIEVLTSFILGLPGEDPQKTVDLIFELDPDYVSINLLVPRIGSGVRTDMGGDKASSMTDSLLSENQGMVKMRDSVEKRFYLRPLKLLNFLRLSLKSPRRIIVFVGNGIGLMKKWFS